MTVSITTLAHPPKITIPSFNGIFLPILFYGLGGLLLLVGAPVAALFYSMGCLIREDYEYCDKKTLLGLFLSSLVATTLVCTIFVLRDWGLLTAALAIVLSLPYVLFSLIALCVVGFMIWSMEKNDRKDQECE
jgi:hypothetical protein